MMLCCLLVLPIQNTTPGTEIIIVKQLRNERESLPSGKKKGDISVGDDVN